MSGNDAARPRFFKQPVYNKAKSDEENRPIFDTREMVEVKIPGDRNFSFVSEVEDEHRARWPKDYEAFQKGLELATTGTPLEEWPNPQLTVGRIEELKHLNIFSVEDLSNVADRDGPQLGMGWRELRKQAQAWLEDAKGGAEMAQLAKENEDLKARLEALERTMAAQASDTEEAAPKRKTSKAA